MELSLPARVVAININYIIIATLWYYIFAWAPTETEFKQLQTFILNFLWGKSLDNPNSCKKIAWGHLIQPKADGGLGLVDPRSKASILHGQWLLKALTPTQYPWKGYIRGRVLDCQAVSHGGKSSTHLLATRPVLEPLEGSLLWTAVWSESITNIAYF